MARKSINNTESGSGDDVARTTTGDRSVRPAQLPLLPRIFAGRGDELELLRNVIAEESPAGPALVVLTGPAGVGKSALALRWLAEHRDEFADGQLFVGLEGPSGPVNPGDVLDWFLVSLGVPPKRVPDAPGQRAAMYRSLTSDRRIAVLLEDAVSAAQVRAAIPAGPDSLVMVTSRSRLSGLALDGARWVEVLPLDESGSLAVLEEILGAERVAAEATATRDLARLCAGLPLALAVAGARLSTRPRRAVQREVADLQNEHRRLEALRLHEDPSVAAVLDSAYMQLAEGARTLYRMCSAHPGREFGVGAAAAAADVPENSAEGALEQLLEANFLSEIADSRFTYHDVLLVHARRRSGLDGSFADEEAAARRVIEWYLDRTVIADLVIHPLRPRLGPRYLSRDHAEPRFADEAAALSWLEQERSNLRSAVDSAAKFGWDELAWQICEALWGFFLRTRHYNDWIAMHDTGLRCAVRCGDRRAEARLRSQLGFAYAKLRRFDDAFSENKQALTLAEMTDDEQAQATALSQLGRAARGAGDLDAALRYFRDARDMQHLLRQWRGVALCRRRIGDILVQRGEYAEAVTELRAAADTMEELGDRIQHARTLLFLGTAYQAADEPALAETALQEALTIVRAVSSPYYEAEVLAGLGAASEQRGDVESAASSYRRAGELYAAAEDPQAAVMQARATSLAQP
ncbi:MAG TPA: tetratricopeptide repeat protein [Actinophytocola sp.]|jgi:tetratricopeptide (TPR) repeat protein|nr:tetratricopeptide repeat protein [Actinophytocola sp.]